MEYLLNLITNPHLKLIVEITAKSLLAVIIGSLIGSERARHGRAAGMRTHILVCLGAALTAMISLYVSVQFGAGDVLRIPAQVISGIGFLGAGMIILKNNNVITGLTTAAGVWTTSIIGIAIGYGFYSGAVITAILFLSAIVLFSKLERKKKSTEVIYVEIDNMYKANDICAKIKEMINTECLFRMVAPKSEFQGHLGINVIIEQRINFNIETIRDIESVVFVEEE